MKHGLALLTLVLGMLPLSSIAADRVVGEGFVAWVETAPPYATGKTGDLRVVIETRDGYHVNPDYPTRFKPSRNSTVTYLKKQVAKNEMTFIGATRIEIPVQFVSKTRGRQSVGGTVSFCPCSDNVCAIAKVDIDATVSVR